MKEILKMCENKSSIFKVSFFLIVSVAFGLIAFYLVNNPFLWYDESGQFWMAKGLNHYSSPFAEHKGLHQALIENRNHNLDPGGFTCLLYFWSQISNSAIWLRILPLLFYMGYLYFLCRLCYMHTHNIFHIGLFLLMALVFPHPWAMTEIRAYSMEMCGVTCAFYLLSKWQTNLDIKRLVILSFVLCFFCTSRYEYFIVAFGVVLYVFGLIFQEQKMLRYKLFRIIIFGLPLLIMVTCIYLYETRFQNAGLDIPDYVRSLYNKKRLLISPLSLLFYVQVGLFIWRKFKRSSISVINKICVIVVGLEFVASLCNKFPWDDYRCIAMSILVTFSSLFEFLIWTESISLKTRYYFYAIVILCMISIGGNLYSTKYVKCLQHRYDCLIEFNNKISTIKEPLFIAGYSTPDIRYLYEYGILNAFIQRDQYPTNFSFATEWASCPQDTINLVFDRWTQVDDFHNYDELSYFFERNKNSN